MIETSYYYLTIKLQYMQSQTSVVNVSLNKQKQALQLKYLLELADQNNQSQLLNILNHIYPFTQYPVDRSFPIQLIQSKQKKDLGKNPGQQLLKYSYIVITGGITIRKKRYQFIQNRFLSSQSQEDIVFSLKSDEVFYGLIANSCVLRIHNIWIDMAKKKKRDATQKYIGQKLMQISFFANLSFEEFSKCCKLASVMILGPKDILLNSGETPYNMYIVAEGQLIFQKRVKILKDFELWYDFKNQLLREEDDTCDKMLDYLAKEPKQSEQTFQVDFKIKNINEGKIICARQTLLEQKLDYSIISTLKTKIIALKYPDLYNLQSDRLAEIRAWPPFYMNNQSLRRDYFYQAMWSKFKEETKEETKLNKLQKKTFQDFLRKNMNMNPEKSYYSANKVGQGIIIDSPAGKVSKLKAMTYQQNNF